MLLWLTSASHQFVTVSCVGGIHPPTMRWHLVLPAYLRFDCVYPIANAWLVGGHLFVGTSWFGGRSSCHLFVGPSWFGGRSSYNFCMGPSWFGSRSSCHLFVGPSWFGGRSSYHLFVGFSWFRGRSSYHLFVWLSWFAGRSNYNMMLAPTRADDTPSWSHTNMTHLNAVTYIAICSLSPSTLGTAPSNSPRYDENVMAMLIKLNLSIFVHTPNVSILTCAYN